MKWKYSAVLQNNKKRVIEEVSSSIFEAASEDDAKKWVESTLEEMGCDINEDTIDLSKEWEYDNEDYNIPIWRRGVHMRWDPYKAAEGEAILLPESCELWVYLNLE